ncbi:cystatin-like [Narcine bancroftii]|uniref:cystatin-like n=1 Tax=Narcine bancroftii TaxID=1343680 RepID=UPI0038316311
MDGRQLLLVIGMMQLGGARPWGEKGEPMVGGPIEISVEDPEVVKAAEFAVEQYNKKNNDAAVYKTERIVAAKQQVVAGKVFFIEMYLGKTECQKYEAKQLEICAFTLPMKRLHCNFEVYSIPWKGETTLQNDVCTRKQLNY